jgi:hypothetical protein
VDTGKVLPFALDWVHWLGGGGSEYADATLAEVRCASTAQRVRRMMMLYTAVWVMGPSSMPLQFGTGRQPQVTRCGPTNKQMGTCGLATGRFMTQI